MYLEILADRFVDSMSWSNRYRIFRSYLFTDSLFLNHWTRIFVSGLLDILQHEIFQLTDRSIDKVVKVVACGIDFAQATAVCLWPPATFALRTNHRFPRSLAFRRLFKCALSFSFSLVFKILPDRKQSAVRDLIFKVKHAKML